jgi:hypothetical protein
MGSMNLNLRYDGISREALPLFNDDEYTWAWPGFVVKLTGEVTDDGLLKFVEPDENGLTNVALVGDVIIKPKSAGYGWMGDGLHPIYMNSYVDLAVGDIVGATENGGFYAEKTPDGQFRVVSLPGSPFASVTKLGGVGGQSGFAYIYGTGEVYNQGQLFKTCTVDIGGGTTLLNQWVWVIQLASTETVPSGTMALVQKMQQLYATEYVDMWIAQLAIDYGILGA